MEGQQEGQGSGGAANCLLVHAEKIYHKDMQESLSCKPYSIEGVAPREEYFLYAAACTVGEIDIPNWQQREAWELDNNVRASVAQAQQV